MNKKLIFVIIIIAVVFLGYEYGYKLMKDRDHLTIIEESSQLLEIDVTDWKTHAISELGIEFKYPVYFGNVVTTKTNRFSCPQMKTYQSSNLLPAQDFVISFSNMPKIGIGGSYIEAKILIAQTENNTDYCGLNISNIGREMSTDSNYTSLNSGRPNIKEEYASNLYTALGTDVDQFYSLLFAKRNQLLLVQPIIYFLPYYNSNELDEIESNGNIINFVQNSKNAEQIRSHFRDFEALVASIKLID